MKKGGGVEMREAVVNVKGGGVQDGLCVAGRPTADTV